MISLKNRLASFVMIEVKTRLHLFRRVVEITAISDVLAQKKNHKKYDKLKR